MTARAVVLREFATRDIEEAVDWYLREAGESIALRFVDELERAFARLAHDPAIGSPRYAHELELAGLRVAGVTGFPYLVFYVEAASHVDVWRVLHGARHVPAFLVDG